MKAFFSWLVLQCVFARVLFGLTIELWKSLHFTGSDSISTFIVSCVTICLAETIVSGVILYDVLLRHRLHDNEMAKLEFTAAHPELKGRY